jgi:hypothetical protein
MRQHGAVGLGSDMGGGTYGHLQREKGDLGAEAVNDLTRRYDGLFGLEG